MAAISSSSALPSSAYDYSSETPDAFQSVSINRAGSVDTQLVSLQREAHELSSAANHRLADGPIAEIVRTVLSLVSSLVSIVNALFGGKMKEAAAQDSGASSAKAKAQKESKTNDGPPENTKPSALKTTEPKGEIAPAKEPEAAKKSGDTPEKTKESRESSRLRALTDDRGAITVMTPDGYEVKAQGVEQAWTITGRDGRTTRIWGDPHVSESDGDRWDFKDRSSFKFGDNKVTVETVPAGNGETFSSRITIYSGDERVTIDGIELNKPRLVAVAEDGAEHDASLDDGNVYERASHSRGESWARIDGRTRDVQGH